MAKCIMWEAPDGSISLTHMANPNATDEEVEAEMQRIVNNLSEFGLTGHTHRGNIERTLEMEDREFRAAWRAGIGRVDIDLSKAKEIKDAKLSQVYDEQIAELLNQHRLVEITGTPAEKAQLELQISQMAAAKSADKAAIAISNSVADLKTVKKSKLIGGR